MLRDAVVDDTLAADRPTLLRVERSGVVLEILDERAGLGTLVEDLGLALIDLAAASHRLSVTPTKNGRSGRYKRGARCVLVRAPLGDQCERARRGLAVHGAEYSMRFSTSKALPK